MSLARASLCPPALIIEPFESSFGGYSGQSGCSLSSSVQTYIHVAPRHLRSPPEVQNSSSGQCIALADETSGISSYVLMRAVQVSVPIPLPLTDSLFPANLLGVKSRPAVVEDRLQP